MKRVLSCFSNYGVDLSVTPDAGISFLIELPQFGNYFLEKVVSVVGAVAGMDQLLYNTPPSIFDDAGTLKFNRTGFNGYVSLGVIDGDISSFKTNEVNVTPITLDSFSVKPALAFPFFETAEVGFMLTCRTLGISNAFWWNGAPLGTTDLQAGDTYVLYAYTTLFFNYLSNEEANALDQAVISVKKGKVFKPEPERFGFSPKSSSLDFRNKT
jgi:hypothetical protein